MEKDKSKILIGFIVLSIVVIGLVGYFLVTTFSSQETTEKEQITINVPDGVAEDMPGSKSEAYQGRKNVSTDEYFEMLAATEDEDISLISSDEKHAANSTTSSNSGSSASERVFGTPPTTNTRYASSGKRTKSATVSRQMTEDEKLEYDRKRAEMVRDVITGTSAEESDTSENEVDIITFEDESDDKIISSLDDEIDDNTIIYGSEERKPFRCMFTKNQKVTNGQRITLRLLEDYTADGVRIPANSHLSAICKIGDRLEISVRSIEMNGKIIPLKLEAYDTDGILGIYCPETVTTRNSRKASNEAISNAGSTFGGLVGDIANTIIRTGANIAKSANGEISVSVVSEYEFFLVKSDR